MQRKREVFLVRVLLILTFYYDVTLHREDFFYPPQGDLLKGPLWGHNLISFCLTSSPIQHFFLGCQMNEWWMFKTVLQISWNFDLNNIIITIFGGGCEGRGVVLRCTRLRCTGLWQRTRNTTSSIKKKKRLVPMGVLSFCFLIHPISKVNSP